VSFCLIKQCWQCCSILPFRLKLCVRVGFKQQYSQQSLRHADISHEAPMCAAQFPV
jgi:hypothetical protein